MSHRSLTLSTPRSLLTLLKQTSPFDERVTRNGIQRDIHVVIKNSPFIVQIGVVKNCDFDLNRVAFDATLLYDTDGDKGVDFVKIKPIEFKCVPNEAGDQVSIELRIKVLTSQHEDMFFKVSIQGTDPVTKQDIANLRVTTNPIKVISKPEQLKKRQPPPPSKKRTVNDMVVEAVTRIERQQAEHTAMMEKLVDMVGPTTTTSKRAHHEISVGAWEFPTRKETESADFETSFMQALKTFSALDPNHRAEKVRRMARSLSVTDTENFTELVDMLTTEGLGQDPGREARPLLEATGSIFDQRCQCAQSRDLGKIDNIFYTSIPYGANAGVLHSSGVLGSSLDGDAAVYSDFLASSSSAAEFFSNF